MWMQLKILILSEASQKQLYSRKNNIYIYINNKKEKDKKTNTI